MVNKDDHKELVARLKGGNHAAFKSIFFMYNQSLRTFAIKELKSEELAEDAVQEVFVKLWLNRENLDPDLSLKGFLFTCLKNHILNAIRTKSLKTTVLPISKELVY
ncbi:MAG: RNA polymerase sigma factor [Cyclobacteriaceae bacterium]